MQTKFQQRNNKQKQSEEPSNRNNGGGALHDSTSRASSMTYSTTINPSFMLRFHTDRQDQPLEVKIKPSHYDQGVIYYEDLVMIIHDEFPISSENPRLKIRYFDEHVNRYLTLKSKSYLDPTRFSKGYVDIKLEWRKQNKVLARNDPVVGTLNLNQLSLMGGGGPNSTRMRFDEEVIIRLSVLEGMVAKLKILISGIVKKTGIMGQEVRQIMNEIYTEEERLMLEMDSPATAQESPNYEAQNLNLAKELSLIKEASQNIMSLEHHISGTGSYAATKEGLDFALLYSHPLVQSISKPNGETYTNALLHDPVDFAGECDQVLRSFRDLGMGLSCHIECATSEQLIKMIQKKPKVLHISCHGDYDKATDEYFLEFENQKAELLKLSPSNLRKMIKNADLSKIKLIFVNACHSESVARVFLEFGVECIVVVASLHKINDQFAKTFSKLFYTELIEGKTINEAFNNSKVQLKAAHLDAPDSCCCGHRHKETCLWYQKSKEIGLYAAHCEHTPCCDCPKKHLHIHEEDCAWADQFLLAYDAECIYYEDRGEMLVCCCSPELPHDETMKLVLIYKDDDKSYGDKVIFDSLAPGTIKQLNPHFFAGTHFKDCNIFGQKKLIYLMFKAMSCENVRIFYLKGDSECGKTSICKHFANFCEERHKFDDVKYINMENTNSIHVFISKIPGITQNPYIDSNMARDSNAEGTLIILDNMDSLFKNDFDKCREKMLEIVEQYSIKFLVTTENLGFFNGKIFKGVERTATIPNLTSTIAAKMLIQMRQDMLPHSYRNPLQLAQHSIFQGSKINITPRMISDVAFLLTKGKSLEEIEKLLEARENQPEKEDQTEMLNHKLQFIREIREKEEHTFSLLSIISLFSNGLLMSDFEHIAETTKTSNIAVMKFITTMSLASNIEDFTSIRIDSQLAQMMETESSVYKVMDIFLQTNNVQNTWIELSRERVAKRDDIRIKADQKLRKMMASILDEETHAFWCLMQPLLYLRSFYSTVIVKHLTANVYLEEIVENTQVNSTCLWSGSLRMSQEAYCYFLEDSVSFDEVAELVKFHDINIRGFLAEDEGVYSFKQSLLRLKEVNNKNCEITYLNVLENVLLQLLTICKIYKNYEMSLEYANYIRKLYPTKDMQVKFKKLDVMVELHVADILHKQLITARGNVGKVNVESVLQQLILLDELTSDFEGEEGIMYRAEYLLTKYAIMAALFQMSKDDKFSLELDQVIVELEAIRDFIARYGDDGNRLEFLTAKIHLQITRHKYERSSFEINDLNNLTDCIDLFTIKNSYKLLTQSYHMMAEIYCKNYEQCLFYSKQGVIIAEKIGEKKLIKEFKKLIDESNRCIRQAYQNKFIFLSSNPMRTSIALPHAGLNLKKDLKSLLINKLRSLNKSILVHFDILNKSMMNELFTTNKGCKMLVIDSAYDKEHGVVGETYDFSEDVYGYDALDKMSKEDKTKINIEILVLLSKKPKRLASFASNKGIPLVIHFELDQSKHFTDIFTSFINQRFKYTFLKLFIEKIVKGQSSLDSIRNAKEESIEIVSHELKTNYKYYEVALKNGIRFCSQIDLNEFNWDSYFSNAVKVLGKPCDQANHLRHGQLEDTSSQSDQFTLHTLPDFYIKRNVEIVKLFDLVNKQTFVNLFSERGLGKSSFLNQFRNELLVRNLFPDGVFLFKLGEVKNLRGTKSVKDLMNRVLGKRFDHNMEEYFKHKKIMIILDDFDVICHEKEVRNPTYLLRALHSNKVPTIFVTRKKVTKISEFPEMGYFSLSGFSLNKSLIYLLSIQKNKFFNFSPDINIKALSKCGIIRKSNGIPANLRRLSKEFLIKELNYRKNLGIHHPSELQNRSNKASSKQGVGKLNLMRTFTYGEIPEHQSPIKATFGTSLIHNSLIVPKNTSNLMQTIQDKSNRLGSTIGSSKTYSKGFGKAEQISPNKRPRAETSMPEPPISGSMIMSGRNLMHQQINDNTLNYSDYSEEENEDIADNDQVRLERSGMDSVVNSFIPGEDSHGTKTTKLESWQDVGLSGINTIGTNYEGSSFTGAQTSPDKTPLGPPRVQFEESETGSGWEKPRKTRPKTAHPRRTDQDDSDGYLEEGDPADIDYDESGFFLRQGLIRQNSRTGKGSKKYSKRKRNKRKQKRARLRSQKSQNYTNSDMIGQGKRKKG